ncbi:hypothetical protein FJV41_39430 [Myxococcus llanfairpwllgwyngyllgogerychwyrndrobwllllantysiliogogogochensis]|uniref:Uncharacterized protein n=1 Tax=Myxococcus llanfairpwllgwyngyllgogerychwyrndrobwllllantysiliogogogochensis TaxID=2590453 RepID=A0A540WN53_9BACT|nr:hypothetical protein [Myxococcus llanfairpwllgwyngyllgogerychwyrndrobwllllantysiliogogogochensis]TQF10440.1 hypothetical protein FJV41_39430 [Myxococcus llanfairpwllgwyngyllgogerychwyrndrobwllllantysiliogogogochensis]
MSTSLESLPAEVSLLRAHFHRVRRMGVTFVEGPKPPPREESRRPSHVARMVALAHHLEAAINRGQMRNAATVALQLGLTRARLTYLLDLRLLAPDIQEELLFLEAVDGDEPLGERVLRAIVHAGTWEAQRQRWRELKASF